MARPKDLIESDRDLERDQPRDNQFETQRALCIDDVSERSCSLGDDGEFPVKR
jgi:hypothetical protein